MRTRLWNRVSPELTANSLVGCDVPTKTSFAPTVTSLAVMMPSPLVSLKPVMGFTQYPPSGYPMAWRWLEELKMMGVVSFLLRSLLLLLEPLMVSSHDTDGVCTGRRFRVASTPLFRTDPTFSKWLAGNPSEVGVVSAMSASFVFL